MRSLQEQLPPVMVWLMWARKWHIWCREYTPGWSTAGISKTQPAPQNPRAWSRVRCEIRNFNLPIKLQVTESRRVQTPDLFHSRANILQHAKKRAERTIPQITNFGFSFTAGSNVHSSHNRLTHGNVWIRAMAEMTWQGGPSWCRGLVRGRHSNTLTAGAVQKPGQPVRVAQVRFECSSAHSSLLLGPTHLRKWSSSSSTLPNQPLL